MKFEIEVKRIMNQKGVEINCYNFTSRGTEYSLIKDSIFEGKWTLSSKRESAARIGQFRRFDSVEEIEAVLKSLKGVAEFVNNCEAEHAVSVETEKESLPKKLKEAGEIRLHKHGRVKILREGLGFSTKMYIVEIIEGKFKGEEICVSSCDVAHKAVEAIEEVKSVDITEAVEAAKESEYIELQTKEATETTETTEAAEPHYVIQYSKETKKLGIFPSYESALKWHNKNSEKYKGMLGIYRVSIYDQELKVKNFELIGGSFKEVEPEETVEEETKVSGSAARPNTMKKRVMPIKNRNIHWGEPTSLKYVMAQRFRNNGYTHVLYRGKEYTCRTVKFDITPNQNVFIDI